MYLTTPSLLASVFPVKTVSRRVNRQTFPLPLPFGGGNGQGRNGGGGRNGEGGAFPGMEETKLL